jgi:cyclophilin family peptidyl-prolyl cis-trans isomerase
MELFQQGWDIQIELYSDVATKIVKNFKKLAKSGFYVECLFHRIVSGFVIQGRIRNPLILQIEVGNMSPSLERIGRI